MKWMVFGLFYYGYPFHMILILDVIPSKLSCDFNKLTIFYIYLYIYSIIFVTNKIFMTNKILSIKYLSVCLLPLCTNSLNYWILKSERGRNIFVSMKLEGQRGARTCDLQLSNAPGPALYIKKVNVTYLFSYWVTKYHKQNKCNQKHLRIICVVCTDVFMNWYELLIFYQTMILLQYFINQLLYYVQSQHVLTGLQSNTCSK